MGFGVWVGWITHWEVKRASIRCRSGSDLFSAFSSGGTKNTTSHNIYSSAVLSLTVHCPRGMMAHPAIYKSCQSYKDCKRLQKRFTWPTLYDAIMQWKNPSCGCVRCYLSSGPVSFSDRQTSTKVKVLYTNQHLQLNSLKNVYTH